MTVRFASDVQLPSADDPGPLSWQLERAAAVLEEARTALRVRAQPRPHTSLEAQESLHRLTSAAHRELDSNLVTDPTRAVEIARCIVNLAAMSSALELHTVKRRLRTLEFSLALMKPLAEIELLEHILQRAVIDIARGCGLDRVVLFQMKRQRLEISAAHFRGAEGWAAECRAFAALHPIDLVPGRFESEVLRRKRAGLVLEAMGDPSSAHPFTTHTATTAYVSAPIICGDRLFGTINADVYFSGRRVDEGDRDGLSHAAAALGALITNATLSQRLVAQRREIGRVIGLSDDELDARRLDDVTTTTDFSVGADAPAREWGQLSDREDEVLTLIARGATNAAIARQLSISEQTVKSHVKHILRKLGAANRAEAAGRAARV